MGFHDRRSVDDSFDVHPGPRANNVDNNDEPPDSHRANSPTSGQSVPVENLSGSTHGDGADLREPSELEENEQATGPQPSTNESLPTASPPVIHHVDQGRILKLSSLRQPRDSVSCD